MHPQGHMSQAWTWVSGQTGRVGRQAGSSRLWEILCPPSGRPRFPLIVLDYPSVPVPALGEFPSLQLPYMFQKAGEGSSEPSSCQPPTRWARSQACSLLCAQGQHDSSPKPSPIHIATEPILSRCHGICGTQKPDGLMFPNAPSRLRHF